MIALAKIFVSGIWNSFHNQPGGLSARKLSAFFGVLMAAYNLRFADTSIAVEMTVTWLCFALLCLGIVTAEQIINFKSGKKNEGGNTPT